MCRAADGSPLLSCGYGRLCGRPLRGTSHARPHAAPAAAAAGDAAAHDAAAVSGSRGGVGDNLAVLLGRAAERYPRSDGREHLGRSRARAATRLPVDLSRGERERAGHGRGSDVGDRSEFMREPPLLLPGAALSRHLIRYVPRNSGRAPPRLLCVGGQLGEAALRRREQGVRGGGVHRRHMPSRQDLCHMAHTRQPASPRWQWSPSSSARTARGRQRTGHRALPHLRRAAIERWRHGGARSQLPGLHEHLPQVRRETAR